MGYRNILEEVRIGVPVKQYETRYEIDGNVPHWLAERLPLFGSEDGEKHTNSGGRGIILESGDETYRIKGVDPKGIITTMVGASDKNIINDIRLSKTRCPDPEHIERLLKTERGQEFPSYKDRPFNFLTWTAVENSKHVFDIMGEEYERLGFSHPCIYAGCVAYPDLKWGNQSLRSIVFQLPDIESDLRETELSIKMRKHLQHASVDQLRDIGDRFIEFYRGLLGWHAFDCRALADHGLLPTEESMLGQNHVVAHVSDGKIGLVRVDHTSTQSTDSNNIYEKTTKFRGILITYTSMIPLALEMADRSFSYDRERYSGYFDAAFKFHDIDMRDWPKTMEFTLEAERDFRNAYETKEPEPIDEAEMTRLFDEVGSIEIDTEFERKKYETARELMKNPDLRGLLNDMGLQARSFEDLRP